MPEVGPGDPPPDVTDDVTEVVVEEVWRGPDLAATVAVANPLYGGAPPIVLEAGGRYLFLAQPMADPPSDPVERLTLEPCSLTRPVSPDLAGLRPADARTMPGFVEAEAPGGSDAPIWPWVVAGLLILATAASYLLRDRMGHASAWLPWATGAGAVAAVGIGAVLALAPPGAATASPSGSAASMPGPSGGGASSTLEPSTPVGDEDPALVVRIRDSAPASGTFGRVVSVHADGRVISTTLDGRVVQQRLAAPGVEAIADAVAATGLFGPDATTASFSAIPKPGANPARGAYATWLVVGRDGAAITVDWTPIPADEVELWQPSEEIAILDGVAERLWDLDAWLSADAWIQAERTTFEATRFRLSDEEIGSGFRPDVALTDVRWPLDPPLDELPATRNPVGLLTRCLTLSRGEAADVVGALSAALGDPTLGLGRRSSVELAGATTGRNHRLTIEPLMPDEPGCSSGTPVAGPTTLSAGAIALVRVDGLRMRESPDSTAAASDALSAGERVALVTESVAPDGSRWWLVRQGPGDRQGWVSAGPTDGDPWLVAVGNGRIAVAERSERIRSMQPDGSDLTTIADAGTLAWSPDGTRALLLVPPTAGGTEWAMAVANADGSGLRHLVVGDAGVWSPDGSRIAFSRWAEDGPSVHVIGADGAGLVRVSDGYAPSWSPDGAALAVWRPDLSARPPSGDGVFPTPEALWIVPLDGGAERQVTPSEVRESIGDPAWSPDGGLIAAGDRLLTPDGTEILRLERGDAFAQWPWSPDGEDLALIDTDPERIGSAGISLLSVDTGELRVVVPAADEPLNQVTWSPDGRFLAYTAVMGADFATLELRTVPATGGEPTTLTVGDSQSPAWQPVVSHALD
jgi:TolB protein